MEDPVFVRMFWILVFCAVELIGVLVFRFYETTASFVPDEERRLLVETSESLLLIAHQAQCVFSNHTAQFSFYY